MQVCRLINEELKASEICIFIPTAITDDFSLLVALSFLVHLHNIFVILPLSFISSTQFPCPSRSLYTQMPMEASASNVDIICWHNSSCLKWRVHMQIIIYQQNFHVTAVRIFYVFHAAHTGIMIAKHQSKWVVDGKWTPAYIPHMYGRIAYALCGLCA